jgi:hypothetical protein
MTSDTDSASFSGPSIPDVPPPAPWVLPLYFWVTLIPLSITILSLRLTPLRVLLLVLFVPFLIRVLRGLAGRFTVVDGLIIGHAAWIILALMVVHGPEKLPFAGITMVELVGGYFMGRVLVRNADDYQRMIWLLLFAMLFLLPFALIELFTGRIVIAEIIGTVFESIYRGSSAYGRMGLERVYAVFEHPILFGMFCSMAIANFYYFTRDAKMLRFAGIIFVTFMTFMSLSSAPLLAIGLQVMLIGWDKVTKGAWKTFLVLGVIGYVTIDLLSNRTPITILIETMTFNSQTGWVRIAIFEFGIQNVYAHPIFGIGFNDWVRPAWLTGSVDNYWLLNAMRYGFVGAGFLVLGFGLHLYQALRAPIHDQHVQRLRVGYMIALCATCFTMLTVHVWGAVGVFVMFYLGAGGWFYNNDSLKDPEVAQDDLADTAKGRDRQIQYTRFPVTGR